MAAAAAASSAAAAPSGTCCTRRGRTRSYSRGSGGTRRTPPIPRTRAAHPHTPCGRRPAATAAVACGRRLVRGCTSRGHGW
eukprot:scaffold144731_cov115-Phaeocystis_antarctica.AAC.1